MTVDILGQFDYSCQDVKTYTRTLLEQETEEAARIFIQRTSTQGFKAWETLCCSYIEPMSEKKKELLDDVLHNHPWGPETLWSWFSDLDMNLVCCSVLIVSCAHWTQ